MSHGYRHELVHHPKSIWMRPENRAYLKYLRRILGAGDLSVVCCFHLFFFSLRDVVLECCASCHYFLDLPLGCSNSAGCATNALFASATMLLVDFCSPSPLGKARGVYVSRLNPRKTRIHGGETKCFLETLLSEIYFVLLIEEGVSSSAFPFPPRGPAKTWRVPSRLGRNARSTVI